MNCEKIKKK